MKSLFIIGALLLQITFAVVHHDNEQLWRISTHGEHKHVIDAIVEHYDLDVWSAQHNHIDVLITPELSPLLQRGLTKVGISYEIKNKNIQEIIDSQAAIRNERQLLEPSAEMDTTIYHTLEDIHAYMDQLAAEFDYITIETLGQSVEGRDMKLLKISTQANNQNAFWIQCGIHAREWVSPATCVWGLDYLTNGYQVDDEVTEFMDAHDIYMVPVVNPDGYSFSWTDDRLWRKNRRVNEDSSCMGVDLNRNYDDGVSFGGPGASDRPCMANYHGPSGFSEPETAILRDRANLIQQTQSIHTYYDIHSYGQYWLMPYGWTTELPANYVDLDRAAAAAVNAIFNLYGTQYTYGPISVELYEASGGSVDWAHAIGAPYAYTPELRDSPGGEYGFVLPEDQIVPTATELWAGLFAAYAAR